jgi:hypothetical protein
MKTVMTYLLTVQYEDGSQDEIIVYEPYEIGSRIKGGKVIACHQLKRTFDID